MSDTSTLQQAAARAGGHCWVERRLFELLGGWSADAPTPGATLALDRHAQHAAWRAAQWYDRLPILAGVDRESLVRAEGSWTALAGPALAGPVDGRPGSGGDAPSPSGLRPLAVVYRVLLPRLAVTYARHAATTSPLADAPVIRTLAMVRRDVVGDWSDGEAVLQELLHDRTAVDVSAAAVAAAEHLFVT